MVKVIKENTNGKTFDWKTTLLRCQYYPKWPTDSMQSLSKSWWQFVAEVEKSILQFIWNLKGSQVAKTILKYKNKVGWLTPDFKS